MNENRASITEYDMYVYFKTLMSKNLGFRSSNEYRNEGCEVSRTERHINHE